MTDTPTPEPQSPTTPPAVAAGELITSAWGNSVRAGLAELNAIINRNPSGTGGIDNVDISSPPNKAVVRLGNNQRFDVNDGAGTAMGARISAVGSAYGIQFGTPAAPIITCPIVSPSGVGDPSYNVDIGSQNPSGRARLRFYNVYDIQASVPWPVASRRAIKTNIEPTDADVLGLHPVSYERTDGVLEGRTLLGFVVEDLVDDMPEAVLYGGPDVDDQQPAGYMTEVILSAAVNTIQKLEARIAALEAAAGP